MFESVNPATGKPLETYAEHDEEEVGTRLARAWTTWESWRERELDDRAELLRRVADRLDDERDELAELMTAEMGKPISSAESEVEKCAWVCRHYADHAAGYLSPEHIETGARASYVRFDPLGPLLAIMPWNFPLWQLFRHAAPSLMAGNVILLKHAENVPGCALAIERLFAESGAPGGAIQTLMLHSSDVEPVPGDDRGRAVTLTGSPRAGRAVAGQAGASLKKTVLELGGSDPFIVLPEADLDRAAEVGASSRLINNGESCIAAKRFIVDASVASEFVDRLTAEMEAKTVGDPMDRDTDVGPLAREDLRDELHRQVDASREAGATVLTGGEPVDGPGFFYEPTVLAGVDARMPAGSEETFGPVAAVLEVKGTEEAVALANASDFGLGASIWTEDRDRAETVAGRIEAGCVFVNELVKSDPRVPFGGVKESGYGRELGSWGIREFTNVKTVWVE